MRRAELGLTCRDVAVKELPELPGFVWKLTICPDSMHHPYRVNVDYELASIYVDPQESGCSPHLRLTGDYEDLDELIKHVEVFLGEPLERWNDYTKHRLVPTCLECPDIERCEQLLAKLVESAAAQVPGGATYEVGSYFAEPPLTWEEPVSPEQLRCYQQLIDGLVNLSPSLDELLIQRGHWRDEPHSESDRALYDLLAKLEQGDRELIGSLLSRARKNAIGDVLSYLQRYTIYYADTELPSFPYRQDVRSLYQARVAGEPWPPNETGQGAT